jgi:hypothetical protein
VFPRIIALLPDVLGDLLAWGRNPDGCWWGLVTWEHRVMTPGVLGGYVYYSAWMPATTLRPSRYESVLIQYEKVVRLNLPAKRRVWPRPADRHDRDTVHYGAVVTEAPVRV